METPFTDYGYAYISVDCRGSGVSYGTRPHPCGPEELKDMGEIIDWITKQPWSDGNVVTWGVSYEGMTAEFAGLSNHQALKGLIAEQTPWDIYTHLLSIWAQNSSISPKNLYQ